MASTFENIQAGMASSMSGKEGDSLMKGRTYIARLSPDTRKALVKALRDRRKKKSSEKELEELKKNTGEPTDSNIESTETPLDPSTSKPEDFFAKYGGKVSKYKYGGKTKKYRK